jgi:hypothetical protein
VKEKEKNIFPIAVDLEAYAYKGMRQKIDKSTKQNERKNSN